MDTEFVTDEDNRFFEIVPTPSEPERPGDVASPVPDLELTIYEILEQVKKRAKEGHGWRTFQRVRFHAFVPEMTGVQSQAWGAAVGEAYELERAYRVDLRDRICGLLNDYGVKPNEDGWRTLSKIAMREAERLNIELSEPPDDSPWRSYAIRLAVQIAARSPDEIAASFRAFQIAPPNRDNVLDDESFARDCFVDWEISEAQRNGKLDPKPFEHLLDNLNQGGFLSNRPIGEEWRLPDDPPPAEPSQYVYTDADRRKWTGRTLRKPNKGKDENANPRRGGALASLKAAYFQRRGKSPLTQSMIEAIYYNRILSDLNRAAKEVASV